MRLVVGAEEAAESFAAADPNVVVAGEDFAVDPLLVAEDFAADPVVVVSEEDFDADLVAVVRAAAAIAVRTPVGPAGDVGSPSAAGVGVMAVACTSMTSDAVVFAAAAVGAASNGAAAFSASFGCCVNPSRFHMAAVYCALLRQLWLVLGSIC